MAFPTKAKYVVIGTGIHGLSTAWHLAEKIKKKGNGSNNDIVVIDKGGIALNATPLAGHRRGKEYGVRSGDYLQWSGRL